MKHTCRLLFWGFLIASFHLAASGADEWNIQVTGLRIVAPPAGNQEVKEDTRGAFFQPPGVTVVATIAPASGKIVSIDQFDSKVETFTDDRGTDLLAAQSVSPFNKPGFGTLDAKESFANVEIQAAGLPARGATALNITGKLSVKVAEGTKMFTIENVAITNGTHFTCGDLAISITKAGMSKAMFSNKEAFSVTFASATDLECLSSLEFFDAQGNQIEAQKNSWGGGLGSYFMEYTLKQSAARAKIVATCWTNLKTVEIPIAIKTGMGL